MPQLDVLQAKWALDAAGISYKLSRYGFSPFYLGELPFRWRVGKLFDRITAPMLLLPNDQGNNAALGLMALTRMGDQCIASQASSWCQWQCPVAAA
jgi:hypothetical protein